jgi:hypothetical protein
MGVAALIALVLVSVGPADPDPVTVPVADRTVVAAAPASSTTTTMKATTTKAPTAASTTGAPTTTTPAAATTTTVDPGTLPQTDDRPVASGARFDAGVQGLWEAIRQDRPDLALPLFFPKSAYLQVKAISDPAGDYQQRLIANYQQDIHTLYAKLGAGAARAQLVGITVPDSQAVWVKPGEEYNKLSYWRVYGSTLQYRIDGQNGSFPVTSLISWRGQWYVVHLGQIR